MGIKRLVLTIILAVVLHFASGVVSCCWQNCSLGQVSSDGKECIRTGRPIDICLESDRRVLLIEIYLVNIFFWWLSVNSLVFLGQHIEWKKISKLRRFRKDGILKE